jgi:hypothetical protein
VNIVADHEEFITLRVAVADGRVEDVLGILDEVRCNVEIVCS